MSDERLERYIDSTILRPDATRKDIEELCAAAQRHSFRAVCVNPVWVELASRLLQMTSTVVCTVVAFPLGAQLTSIKTYETEQVLHQGASEVDVVINLGAARGGDWALVEADLRAVVAVCRSYGAVCKAILEMCLLSPLEKRTAAVTAVDAGVDYLKTSTGFSRGGATIEDVRSLKRWGGPNVLVKAAGGIKTKSEAWEMIKAGASRIGTSRAIDMVG